MLLPRARHHLAVKGRKGGAQTGNAEVGNVIRDSDRGFGLNLMNDFISRPMGLKQVLQHCGRRKRVPFSGEPAPEKISLAGVDRRFVDCHPKVTEIPQLSYNKSHIRGEVTHSAPVLPTATLEKPERVGEVVQRN